MNRFTLPPQIDKALSTLNSAGFEGYIVGGCVRDILLGKIPYDFDIASDALPEEVKEAFRDYHVIETGLIHGTVTVVIDGMNIEVTTFRIDGNYSDSRRPDSVSFTRSLREDLARRDFTINAMAYSHETGVIDYFDGMGDIESQIIRCVGDPEKRFTEDALRILRALRFASVLGFSIEEKTAVSIHKNCRRLENISKERIASEISKLLCGEGAEKILLNYTDVIGAAIPEIMPMRGFNQNNKYHIYDVLEHTAKVLSNTPPLLHLRLAALFHDIGKPSAYTDDKKGIGHFYGHPKMSRDIASKIMMMLKYDNQTINSVCLLVLNHDCELVPASRVIKRWMNRLSEPALRDLVSLKKADVLAQNPVYNSRLAELDKVTDIMNEIMDKDQCFLLGDLAVNGSDLIETGFKEGKEIGIVLNRLLDRVIDEELINERNTLINEAVKMLKP